MFNQTDPKYKTIMLGNGTGSIYNYGCYLVSLCNGLNQKGYNFTPEGINQTLKDKGLWVGPYGNYIDIANIANKWPEVFSFFDKIDPWGAEPLTDTLINDQLVVLGRVSAKPIGGSGDHYVLIKGVKNGVAIIYDPWSGVEEPITNRWASFGYILGICIFKVKPVVTPVVEPITDQTKIPMGNNPDGTPWGDNGQMEVQAARGTINDEYNAIKSLKQAAQNAPKPPETPAPTTSPETPVPTPQNLSDQAQEAIIKVGQIKAIIYGKGWWWAKIAKIKELLPNG